MIILFKIATCILAAISILLIIALIGDSDNNKNSGGDMGAYS